MKSLTKGFLVITPENYIAISPTTFLEGYVCYVSPTINPLRIDLPNYEPPTNPNPLYL